MIMKKYNFLKGLLMFMLAFFATTSALAQDLKLSAERCFIAPGGTGSVVLSMANDVEVGSYTCKVTLPEELSFVITEGDKIKSTLLGRCENNNGLRPRCEVTAYDPHTCVITLGTIDEDVKVVPGSGEIFSFEVKASDKLPISDIITVDKIEIGPKKYELPLTKQPSFTTYACNSEYKLDFAVEPIQVTVGQPTKVAISLGFEKAKIAGLQFDLVLPKGLKAVNKPQVVEDRCPEYVAKLAENGHFVVRPQGLVLNDFVGTSGELCSFEIEADENFVEGSEIQFNNIMSSTSTPPYPLFHAPNLKVKVTKAGTATGINAIESDFAAKADGIYTVSGLKVNKLVKGINIVVKDGKATKVVKK